MLRGFSLYLEVSVLLSVCQFGWMFCSSDGGGIPVMLSFCQPGWIFSNSDGGIPITLSFCQPVWMFCGSGGGYSSHVVILSACLDVL